MLIIGSGHLWPTGYKKLVAGKGYEVLHRADVMMQVKDDRVSAIDAIAAALQPIDFPALSMTYILDEKDEYDLELVIALMALHSNLPITTSLFNENIRPHLQAVHPGCTYQTRPVLQLLIL